jgi:hypothetical protein
MYKHKGNKKCSHVKRAATLKEITDATSCMSRGTTETSIKEAFESIDNGMSCGLCLEDKGCLR